MNRPDNLGTLPFTDYADPDPDRLPLDGDPWSGCGHGRCWAAWAEQGAASESGVMHAGRLYNGACEACNAEPGELCRPWCIAVPLDPFCICGGGRDHDDDCPRVES